MPAHIPFIDGKKLCTKCGADLFEDEFGLSSRAVHKKNSWCKKCRIEDTDRWRKANPDKALNTAWVRKLQEKYGLTEADYNSMLISQNGVCGICGADSTPRKHLDVDHSHVSGKVRGLLCRACNQGLGLILEKVDIAEKLILYLEGTLIIDTKEVFPKANLTRQCRVFLRDKYGIDEIQFQALWNTHSGACAVCRMDSSANKKMLAVDHCHATGEIRGLLCSQCNLALGVVSDNAEILRRMLDYLHKHQN